jgi:DNA-binding MarR family transcriptional regulator
MDVELPLPALLSAAFVAFTIEADNEAERVVAHRTTSFGGSGERGAVWLTSLAMWWNCLRPLASARGPLTVAELHARARMQTNLDGMRRWGYITIDGVGRVRRGVEQRPLPKPSSTLALTRRGEAAAAIWQPMPAEIERRWRERFGVQAVDRLRGALIALARQDVAALPDFLPIGRIAPASGSRSAAERDADAELSLVSLLARVLMRFTLDYQDRGKLPLAAWCNLLRVLEDGSAEAVRELPRLTAISKEALAVLTGRLEKAGCVVLEPLSGTSRGRQLRLTERGARARTAGERRIDETVRLWEQRTAPTAELADALGALVGDGTRVGSPVWAGLEPPAHGWRAQIPLPELLPWHPMVSHRGGYPDGA